MVSWEIVALFTGPVLTLWAMTRLVSYLDGSVARRLWQRVRRAAPRALGGGQPMAPPGRPIEDIARDARRLGRQLRSCDNGRSAMRIGVLRASYDDVLGESCAALGRAHLLAVLPPDTAELDAERRRVEVYLVGAGMVLEDVY